MKTEFPEFQGYNDNQFKKLFDECTFVFDTNVLLNLYKYSTETKNELLEILNKIENRLWMPHQVGLEYNFNRLSVVSDQEKFYNKLISSIEKDSTSFINGLAKDYNKKHPFIKWDEIKTQLENCIKSITTDIAKKKEKHPNLFADDEILSKINELFKGKIGRVYSQEELNEIYKEGKDRYARKCPPGYKDLKDKEGQIKEYGGNVYKDEYGDLVVWYQIIEYAEKNKQPIIFITDDNKEDWWREQSGKTIGPRIELLNEFELKAKVPFYMYRTDSFMEKIRTHLHEKVNSKAIEEVKELDLLNEMEKKKLNGESLQEIIRVYNKPGERIVRIKGNERIKPHFRRLPSRYTPTTEQVIKELIYEIRDISTEATEYYTNAQIDKILQDEDDDLARIEQLEVLKYNVKILEGVGSRKV
ncbi:PIN domain-containing protein [Bacillus albus]|uniref:PIN domain-containing protein n=1 Tax=Bacillus cereus group TaxID=86661 RepID=UPI0022DEC193|nr:PIN domain-containing protein [Bacillus cereus group sp. Bc177]MDA2320274.1 PIN domain-containing protein [Bacillus cereus group sp. Bc177]